MLRSSGEIHHTIGSVQHREVYPVAARELVDQVADSASDRGRRSLVDALHVRVAVRVKLRHGALACTGCHDADNCRRAKAEPVSASD